MSSRGSSILRKLAIAAGLTGVATLAQTSAPQSSNSPSKVTFNRDIAPIIFKNCSVCHGHGGSGPFPFLNYAEVKSHARQILTVTELRMMPPWPPEKGDFKFADESRLSPDQIALIHAWIEDGEPEGAHRDPRAVPRLGAGQTGKPDLVLTPLHAQTIDATGNNQFRTFRFVVPIRSAKWLRGIEVQPGNPRILREAEIVISQYRGTGSEESALTTATSSENRFENSAVDTHLFFWAPGTSPYMYPEGMAARIKPHSVLILNARYQPSGKTEIVAPKLALYFTDRPGVETPIMLRLQNDSALNIPPGTKDFEVTDDFLLPVAVDVLAIYPRANSLGKDLEVQAILPDGTVKDLIHITHWNPNWQRPYRYAEKVFLPKSTTIAIRYFYDNSAQNPANPNDAPVRAFAGTRAGDEQAHLSLLVVPHGEGDEGESALQKLQEAVLQHSRNRRKKSPAASRPGFPTPQLEPTKR